MPLEGLKKQLIDDGWIIDLMGPIWMVQRGQLKVVVTDKLARILERGKPAREVTLDQLETELARLGFLPPKRSLG